MLANEIEHDGSEYMRRTERSFAFGDRFTRIIGLSASLVLSACLSMSSAPARGDAVTDWNRIADDINIGALPPGPHKFRVLAMMHIAVHDALNSIDPRFESYTAVLRAKNGASPDAAVAAASYRVLSQTVPSQTGALALIYVNRIAELPECAAIYPDCIEDGIDAGETAAHRRRARPVLAVRLDAAAPANRLAPAGW